MAFNATAKAQLHRHTLSNMVHNGASKLRTRISTPNLSELPEDQYVIPLEVQATITMVLLVPSEQLQKIRRGDLRLTSQGIYQIWYSQESRKQLITEATLKELESAVGKLGDFIANRI
jgi:hypothetical protein